MRQTITLYRGRDAWMARHTNPEVVRWFGTDTLPTAFTKQTDAGEVLALIRDMDTNCSVQIQAEGGTA